jgi:hypothetical protein
MLGIALNLGGTAILDRDQHTTGIRTIMRANGMDHILHADWIIEGFAEAQ